MRHNARQSDNNKVFTYLLTGLAETTMEQATETLNLEPSPSHNRGT